MISKETLIPEASIAINDACKHVMSFYTGDTRKAMEAFKLRISGQTPLYSIFCSDKIAAITESVFMDKATTDYVLALTVNFYARISNFGNLHVDFINQLAEAIYQGPFAPTAVGGDSILIPKQIYNRLPTKEEIISALQGNKWIATLMMVALFVPLKTE